MRRLSALLVAVMTLVLTAGAARAIELRNEDALAYTVVVISPSLTQSIRLGPRAASLVVCTGTCSFRVAGAGTVRASGNDVVTIRKRKVLRVAAVD